MFIRVRIRFEKSSPRWRIVGREEIRVDKIHRKSFLNSLEEIAQRSEFRRSVEAVCSMYQNRARSIARSTGVHDVHRCSPVDRPVDRGKEIGRPVWSIDWHSLDLYWSRSTDRSIERQDRSIDRRICSLVRIRTSFLF